MKKKLLSLALIIALVLSVAIPAFADEPAPILAGIVNPGSSFQFDLNDVEDLGGGDFYIKIATDLAALSLINIHYAVDNVPANAVISTKIVDVASGGVISNSELTWRYDNVYSQGTGEHLNFSNPGRDGDIVRYELYIDGSAIGTFTVQFGIPSAADAPILVDIVTPGSSFQFDLNDVEDLGGGDFYIKIATDLAALSLINIHYAVDNVPANAVISTKIVDVASGGVISNSELTWRYDNVYSQGTGEHLNFSNPGRDGDIVRYELYIGGTIIGTFTVEFTTGAIPPNPITSIKIYMNGTPTGSSVSMPRNGSANFTAVDNNGEVVTGIEWTVSNPVFAIVDQTGRVATMNQMGVVILVATDPVSGLIDIVTIRIA